MGCKNTVGSYECVCKGGKTGFQCLSDFDECSLNPCGSKMTCINEGNSYRCECSEDGCELDTAYERNNFVMIDVDEEDEDETDDIDEYDDASTQKTETEYYY